eukprot:7381425-Prymnesium_polylepis.1
MAGGAHSGGKLAGGGHGDVIWLVRREHCEAHGRGIGGRSLDDKYEDREHSPRSLVRGARGRPA